jgi:hypothetical protein
VRAHLKLFFLARSLDRTTIYIPSSKEPQQSMSPDVAHV